MRIHALPVAAALLLGAPPVGGATHAAAPAATLTVNSTGDEADSVAGDGLCRTAAGACTLRAAIEEANARTGADTIRFSIGSGARVIAPVSPLPVIFEELVIDGATQPGFGGSPLIELDGSAIEVDDIREGPGIDGLVLVNGHVTVRALAIGGFGGAALVLTEGDGNRVEGVWIGTGASGVEDKGNGGDGIVLLRSSDNVIGGVEAGQRNLIAGNDGRGILISDTTSSGNQIQGNVIGIGADGAARPNGSQGILILGAPDNVIGGTAPAAGNVVAGNAGNGIEISGSSASGNRIEGNLVGARGADDPGNAGTGIVVDGAPNTVIGGAEEARNWVAGNGGDGVAILGGAARGNVVAGNLIGIASDGGQPRGNDGDGILIAGAPENTIGGPVSAVLPPAEPTGGPSPTPDPAHTPDPAVTPAPGPGPGTGTPAASPTPESTGAPPATPDPTLTAFPPPSTPIAPPPMPPLLGIEIGARPSAGHRSAVSSRLDSTSAATTTHAGNIIGHSSGDGIEISGTGARANRILGNRIGVDAGGGPAGNRANGIFISGAPDNLVGGGAEHGNAIAANARNGVAIVGIGASGNRLEGNQIGVLPAGARPEVDRGDSAIDRELANGGEGVLVLGAPDNRIGAESPPDSIGIPPAPGAAAPSTRGNVIAGNRGDGVRIAADGADGNRVEWNAIGILGGALGELPSGNGGDGVAVVGGARRNRVGGNTIIASHGHGVSITGAGTDHNVVTGNRLGADEAAGNGDPGASASGDGALVRAGASHNELSDNAIEANLRHGIHLHGTGTEGNAVTGNSIRAPSGAGIQLSAGASGNRIGALADAEIGDAGGGRDLPGRLGGLDDDGAGPSDRDDLDRTGVGVDGGDLDRAGVDGEPWSNTVSLHAAGGIVLAGADDNRVEWNRVVADAHPGPEGGAPVGSGADEPAAGIHVRGARNVVGPGNVVAGQRGDGIVIAGSTSVENHVHGNWIGLEAPGVAGANGGSGVRTMADASQSLIGSTAPLTIPLSVVPPGPRPPLGNVIAHNGADGIRIDSGIRNRLAANHIFGNAGLAIDLGGDGAGPGPGAGEPGGADGGGPNRGQPAPAWRAGMVRADAVAGVARGRAGRALRLELFTSRRCRPQGAADAEEPLAALDIAVGADGTAGFQLDLMPLAAGDTGILLGRALSATATDLEGNTSELSPCSALLVPQVFLPAAAR